MFFSCHIGTSYCSLPVNSPVILNRTYSYHTLHYCPSLGLAGTSRAPSDILERVCVRASVKTHTRAHVCVRAHARARSQSWAMPNTTLTCMSLRVDLESNAFLKLGCWVRVQDTGFYYALKFLETCKKKVLGIQFLYETPVIFEK